MLTQQQSITENYFHKTVSGRSNSSNAVLFDRYCFDGGFGCGIDFACIRSITVRSTVSKVVCLEDCRRYYYGEQCCFGQELKIEALDKKSVNASTVERQQLDCDSMQCSAYQPWTIYPSPFPGPELYYDQPPDESLEFLMEIKHDENYRCESCDDLPPGLIANDDNGDMSEGFGEDGWERINDGEQECDSEVESGEPWTAEECREKFQVQENAVRRLRPYWWILQQTRWPGYIAPQHMTKIKRFKQKFYFSRASSLVLRSDLLRLGLSCEKVTLFLLLDSLSLSPFSPIIIRTSVSPDRINNTVTWYGLDWYSLYDAYRAVYKSGNIKPKHHFKIPILPFTMFYLHNWIAYMSRVELYGSSLGYSRPLNAGTLASMGSTCLTPASLGCGQCCYADGWPLWLLWRVSRCLCQLLAVCCSRPVQRLDRDESNPTPMGIAFPFSDLDEI